ncbi:Ig-like domain-containing protein [Aquimarina algiphila]|uniref:Ig-like domain-containing protein n=1 Tax=Aquimarina algiphila TaxID=2047982 RepID=UPI0023306A4E|nr:Ig-like domain-containing protein [Aquimarina algiphila]
MKILNNILTQHRIRVHLIITIFFSLGVAKYMSASDTTYNNTMDTKIIACSSPAWVADNVYIKGDKVTYQGTEYEAFHWTQNQNPASNNSQWGPWVEVGPCDGSNIVPTVSISSPLSGATFTTGNSITISADALDTDGTITKVEFLVDGIVLSEDTSAPYIADWTATSGNHTLTARATDNDNAVTVSSDIVITVSIETGNQMPIVAIVSPANNSSFTTGENVGITADASDADGSVSKIVFYVDGNMINEDTSSPYTINWTATEGTHSLVAIATDNEGASSTSSEINITVQSDTGGGSCNEAQYVEDGGYVAGSKVQNDGNIYECKPWPFTGWCNGGASAYAPGSGTNWEDAWVLVGECGSGGGDGEPTVSITSPSTGQSFIEGNSITISANASDDNGTITKVEFFSNGIKLGEDTTSPYNFDWSGLSIGNYSLTAIATDNDNLSTTSSAVNIRVITSGGGGGPLPERVLNGYWHNFQNGSGLIKLRDVSSNWDIINVSFAEPKISSTDGELGFELAPEFNTINYTESDFKSDIQYLKGIGKKVIISIGGAEGQVRLNTISARDKFITSMISIIEEYDFDGMDIDFEGQSLSLDLGDTDFKNPTTPVLVNTINAVESVYNHFGNDFILTMAPETFFVQLGYSFYGGISQGADRRAGAYLPLIHALRDKLTFLQVQYYNSGSITALDDSFYSMGNADFYVALVDMLLKGFPITKDSSKFFPALRPDQILIGVPATVNAGGGFTGSQGVIDALDYLINGNSFGGQYSLSQNYPGLRGVMSWSINWDQFGGFAFSNPVRTYLDGLGSRQITTSVQSKALLYPNPLQDRLQMQLDTETSVGYTLELYNHIGIKVFEYTGLQTDKRASSPIPGINVLEPGVYIYKIKVADQNYSGRIIKE